MPIAQRQIVELDLGEGSHPYVILSNSLAIEIESNHFVCVMMTSSIQDDEFTFEIEEGMLTKPNEKNYAEVRCHLIHFASSSQINTTGKYNEFTKEAFGKLIERIKNTTFNLKELELF